MNELPERLQRMKGNGNKNDSQNRLATFQNNKSINIPFSLGQKIKDRNISLISTDSTNHDNNHDDTSGALSPASVNSKTPSKKDSEVFIKFNGKETTPSSAKKNFTGSIAETMTNKDSKPFSMNNGNRSPLARHFSVIQAQQDTFSDGGKTSGRVSSCGTSRTGSVLSTSRDLAGLTFNEDPTDAQGQGGLYLIEKVNREKMFIQVSIILLLVVFSCGCIVYSAYI